MHRDAIDPQFLRVRARCYRHFASTAQSPEVADRYRRLARAFEDEAAAIDELRKR